MFPLLRHTCPKLLRSNLIRIPITSVYIQSSSSNRFPSFPRSTSIFDLTPKSFHPFIRLSRIDKPTGSWVIFFPAAWSIAFAGLSWTTLSLTGLFALGTILIRGAGCTINDLWDRDYDRRVERTKTRPIASGELTTRQAVLWTGAQLSLGFLILIQMNWPTIAFGVLSLIPVMVYPVMKRYTYWPQIFLGLTLNWGVFMGFTAATGLVVPSLIVPLYFASVAWTLHYDTIYAHQDKYDDQRIGVKSTALLLGKDSKLWLRAFSFGMISHLVTAGFNVDQTWPYFLGLTVATYHLHRQIENVDLNNSQSCWNTFVSNRLTGTIVLISILLGNCLK